MDAAAELGRNPVSKHQIQPEYRDEQADTGRDGSTRLARPNSQARTGTGIYIFPVQLTTSRIGSLTRLIHTLLVYSLCDDHTYIPTCQMYDIKETVTSRRQTRAEISYTGIQNRALYVLKLLILCKSCGMPEEQMEVRYRVYII